MAQTRIANGDKIIIVDMENGASIVYGQAPNSGDMWDNKHPYETGYEKMATVWLEGDSHGSLGLSDFLPACQTSTSNATEFVKRFYIECFPRGLRRPAYWHGSRL